MKNSFYLILIPLSLLFFACDNQEVKEEKFSSSSPLETKTSQTKSSQKQIIKQSPTENREKSTPKEYQFTFEDLEKQTTTLTIKKDVYTFSNIKQPIILISFFSTWCPPCRGEIPHLSNLQKKFKNDLFILSALVHDDISNDKLKKFIIAQKVKFFIANTQDENMKFANIITPKLGLETNNFPLPLMILFVNGKYFTHYEGIMPEEMIESDIKQLIKKINK